MAWKVMNQRTIEDDWRGTTWTIDRQDTKEVEDGNRITVNDGLEVTLEQRAGESRSGPGTFHSENGLLVVTFPANDVFPKEMQAAFSLIKYQDTNNPDNIDPHITVLTTEGDPDDAGVMGGEGGGGLL